MYIQEIANSDSLSVLQDSIKSVTESGESLNTLNISLSNIHQSDVILTVLGYSIVFMALIVLYLFFSNISRFLKMNIRKKLKATGKVVNENDDSLSGETSAAIAMALTLHFQEIHDFENTVITIKKVQNTYSPWNSKLHGLRQYPKY